MRDRQRTSQWPAAAVCGLVVASLPRRPLVVCVAVLLVVLIGKLWHRVSSYRAALRDVQLAAPTDGNSHFVGVPHTSLRVHVREHAPRDAATSPPARLLLAFHGFGASALSFDDAAPLLAGSRLRFRSLAVDCPGFGFTSRPQALRMYKYGFVARQIADAVRAKAPELPCAVMGHSLGSVPAILTAYNNRDTCEGLVLVAPAVLSASVRTPARWRVLDPIVDVVGALVSPFLQLCVLFHFSKAAVWRCLLHLSWSNPAKVKAETVWRYQSPNHCAEWDVGVVRFMRAALRGGHDVAAKLEFLHAQGVPILIIHGRDDVLVPASNSEALAARLPGCRLSVVPDCGHVPHEERPEEVVRIMQSFFEGYAART